MTEAEERNYRKIVKGIAMQFGKNCEVVLHDYSKPCSSTIIAIENSHITGRKIGDCSTNLGLQILSGKSQDEDQYNYITQLKNNHLLRSTSIYLWDEKNNAIGAICINFDITDILSAKNVIEGLSLQSNALQNENNKPEEFITNDINSLLDSMIVKSVEITGIPVERMTKTDKIDAIRYLERHGALLIKKSAERIAKYFGISKFTLYNYLNESNQSESCVCKPKTVEYVD